MWIVYSIAAAVLLSLSNLFAKCGVKRAAPTVVTSLRTLVIAVFAWVVFFTSGSADSFSAISGTSFLYIALTGGAFAAAMICYHSALKKGDLVRVSALEKSASLLIMLVAVLLYNHTSYLYIRIISMVLLSAGIILMLTKKGKSNGTVILYGVLFAVAAAAAYILDATGISVRNGDLLLALILTVVLIVSLISSFISGLQGGIGKLPMSEFMFTLLSGFSAGLAWLSYRYACAGDLATVTAIIGMSFAVTVGLASLFLKEKVSWKTVCGMLLIIVGTLMYEFMI